ncbi:hypothetical protein GCM10009867_19880 [Pedococcus aerophilus]|uniref:Uncharacterized protein n=1 Tax=Pedococcus aerophilus TaxID=436356 RepID=A0ABN3UN75_9MICO
MTHERPHGTHHSHSQPRRGNGMFISYDTAGRSLGRLATSHGRRVVVAGASVRLTTA